MKKSGPPTEKERREWLKKEHKLGTNTAWWIAERAEGKGTEEDSPEAYLEATEQWVDAMFSGPREALRPLYDQLLKLAVSLGKDVKASPGKTIVPLYRNHVFAPLKPATNTRIDVGFARQHEDAETADRYRRVREERPDYATDRSEIEGRY